LCLGSLPYIATSPLSLVSLPTNAASFFCIEIVYVYAGGRGRSSVSRWFSPAALYPKEICGNVQALKMIFFFVPQLGKVIFT
jgi:hypothetical protein